MSMPFAYILVVSNCRGRRFGSSSSNSVIHGGACFCARCLALYPSVPPSCPGGAAFVILVESTADRPLRWFESESRVCLPIRTRH